MGGDTALSCSDLLCFLSVVSSRGGRSKAAAAKDSSEEEDEEEEEQDEPTPKVQKVFNLCVYTMCSVSLQSFHFAVFISLQGRKKAAGRRR